MGLKAVGRPDAYMNTVIPRSGRASATETVGLPSPYAGVRGPVRPPYASKLIGDRQETAIAARKMYQWLTQLQIFFENELFKGRVCLECDDIPN